MYAKTKEAKEAHSKTNESTAYDNKTMDHKAREAKDERV